MLSNVKKGNLIVTDDQQSFIVIDTDYNRSKYPIKAVSINKQNRYFARIGKNIEREDSDIVTVYPMSTCLSIRHKELFIKESDFNQTFKQIDSNLELISTGLFQKNLIVKASNQTRNLCSKKRILMSALEDYKQ